MLFKKKLTVKYFSPANRFYKAKLEEQFQVITLSQQETTRLIDSTPWTSTETKHVQDNKRTMIEKTYVLENKP